jgi:hypothetical protein
LLLSQLREPLAQELELDRLVECLDWLADPVL